MSSRDPAQAVASGKARERRGRRLLLTGFALAVALGAAAAVILSNSGSAGAVTSNEPEIKRQLVERLHQHALYPHWVACVPNGRSFEGAAVIRCNVNYGDPHVEAICGVLRGGELLTDHDEAAIPCGPDRRGWHPLIHTYG
ncbi:MAG: hypothetical protein JST08_17255 [Actinobacteria bacterium]|nr:hypothetical protein [Actinomycetota bacterium]